MKFGIFSRKLLEIKTRIFESTKYSVKNGKRKLFSPLFKITPCKIYHKNVSTALLWKTTCFTNLKHLLIGSRISQNLLT